MGQKADRLKKQHGREVTTSKDTTSEFVSTTSDFNGSVAVEPIKSSIRLLARLLQHSKNHLVQKERNRQRVIHSYAYRQVASARKLPAAKEISDDVEDEAELYQSTTKGARRLKRNN